MTDPVVVRPFRGVSAAERMKQRREALLDAGLSALENAAMSSITVDDVSARAGLSKRYFYEHFQTRNDLFAALADRLVEQLTAAVAALPRPTDRDLADRIEGVVGVAVAVLTEDPRNARLFVEALGGDQLTSTVTRTEHEVTALLVEVALAGAALTDAERVRLNTVGLILVAGAARAVSDWLTGSIDVPLSALCDDIVQVATAAVHTIRPDL